MHCKPRLVQPSGIGCHSTDRPSDPAAANYRGSVFRLIVGTALITRDGHDYLNWGRGGSASRDVRKNEIPLE